MCGNVVVREKDWDTIGPGSTRDRVHISFHKVRRCRGAP